jgi:DNA polymerase-3 subunit delta
MPELKRAQFEQALLNPDRQVRLWMVVGEDEGQAEALAKAAADALGGPRHELDPASLAADPARLADEAGALSLFGDRPHLFVRASGQGRPDSLKPAVEALFAAPAVANPVVLLVGALSKASPLRQLAASHPLALLVIAWAPEPAQAKAQVAATARGLGLSLPAPLADRLWQAAGAHPQVAKSELEKIALYLGASPDHPKRVDEAVLDALLADGTDSDMSHLVSALLVRDGSAMGEALGALQGEHAIPLLRAAARSLFQLSDLATRMNEAGLSAEQAVAAARPPVFWKERPTMTRALSRWPLARLSAALSALLAAERAIKTPGSAGDRIARQLLLRLAAGRG